jgi:hypothetical protein
VSTDLDLAESAIIPVIAMIFAGINAALNTVISITFVHNYLLFYLFINIIMSPVKDNI